MKDVGKILIVDSEAAPSMRLASIFLRSGWPTISATSTTQANSLTRKEQPSAIVLSSSFPDGGARKVLMHTRCSAYTVGVPVIVLSREGGITKEEAVQAGATDYILPPEDPEVICNSVRLHVEGWPVPTQAPDEVLSRPGRMASLKTAEVLDTAPSRLQDSITRITAAVLGVPVALLSIVDRDRQFFKSQSGLPDPWASQRQTPLSHSFCQWVASSEEELIVENATEMDGLKNNLAITDLGVISYAGIPIHSPSGPVLGSFCAVDSKPHAWSNLELANLRNLAHMSEAALNIELSAGTPTTRCSAMLTFVAEALQILRRGQMKSPLEATALLLELIEDQNRSLSHLVPKAMRAAAQ
jgi:DNA-binding response OmpR family regulator